MITCKDCPYWKRDETKGRWHEPSDTGKCLARPPQLFRKRIGDGYGGFSHFEYDNIRPKTHKDDFCIIPNEKLIIRHSFPNIE